MQKNLLAFFGKAATKSTRFTSVNSDGGKTPNTASDFSKQSRCLKEQNQVGKSVDDSHKKISPTKVVDTSEDISPISNTSSACENLDGEKRLRAKRRRIQIVSDSDDDADADCKKVARSVKSRKKSKWERLDLSSDSDYSMSATSSSASSSDGESEGEEEDTPAPPPRKCAQTQQQSKVKGKPPPPSTATPVSARKWESPGGVSDRSEEKRKTPSTLSKQTKARLSAFTAAEDCGSAAAAAGGAEEVCKMKHLTFKFLQPGKLRDINGNPEGSPDYDARTLKVPDDFLGSVTPGHRQWWDTKMRHFDCVLFFKVGKFYELYHMDAVTGVTELGLQYMKGDYAHSGFPEIAYDRYAEALIQKGYKVARVEQTETPVMMEERCRQSTSKLTKYDRVVKREVCRITSKGTRTFNFIEGDSQSESNNYLLALCEKVIDEGGGRCCSRYGVCFVDTSIGIFHVGEFSDDRHSSSLRTLLSHHPVVHVLTERGNISQRTRTILDTTLSTANHDHLAANSEFWGANKTLKCLSEGGYFRCSEDDGIKWPDTLRGIIQDADTASRAVQEGHTLAMRSVGAITWYLRLSCIDHDLLSMGNFQLYVPPPASTATAADSLKVAPTTTTTSDIIHSKHMILDDITLRNLDILENSCTGGSAGTLLSTIDYCKTSFGKRLLRQWLCAPLCSVTGIEERLSAVDYLVSHSHLMQQASPVLGKLPDLNRLITKFHALGSKCRSENHPDSRAIFYEEIQYSKKKITDLFQALKGFKSILALLELFQAEFSDSDCSSTLLKQCVLMQPDGGKFPDITEQLQYFDNAFNHKEAEKEGRIIPKPGFVAEYDTAVESLAGIEARLQDYLEEQRRELKCRSIEYWGSGRNRYQLEVPEGRAVPQHYDLRSSKKGFKRYWTREIESLLAELTAGEECRDAALRDSLRRIFYTFDSHCEQWHAAVHCTATLDVLLSLATFTTTCGADIVCRPEVLPPNSGPQPFIEIYEGRHPAAASFIPNDTIIGCAQPTDAADTSAYSGNLLLLTGPNMGGKSTLMRQVGLLVILSQLGCYVPARRCRLTPVDRVFTRLGASDNIIGGESTFYVELSETCSILRNATAHSLVLLDELGRGTATYDGTAIAHAVLRALTGSDSDSAAGGGAAGGGGVRCRTMFSTHYHSLLPHFSGNRNVQFGHMACMLESNDDDDETLADRTGSGEGGGGEQQELSGLETITFLYKYALGSCPKSYGFNAAKLADLPDKLIRNACLKAKHFEEQSSKLMLFRKILSSHQAEALRHCIRASREE